MLIVFAIVLVERHRLASGSSDETVRIWDTCIGECAHELKGHSLSANSVSYSPDGKT